MKDGEGSPAITRKGETAMTAEKRRLAIVEGMTLKEIARKYGIHVNTVRDRYFRWERTIAELTRPVKALGIQKKSLWDTPHRFSEGAQYRVRSGYVTVCDIVRKSRTGFLTVCVGKARHRVEIRHCRSYECITFLGVFGEPVILTARAKETK